MSSFTIEGHQVVYSLKELPSSIKPDLENFIGRAKRMAGRDYQPGTAIRLVFNQGLKELYIDGKEVNWRSGDIPEYWDEEQDKSLFEILLEKVLEQKSARRILLRNQEYANVFSEYAPERHLALVPNEEENPT